MNQGHRMNAKHIGERTFSFYDAYLLIALILLIVSGKKYTSQLYGETGIQTPDDYYPAMKEMTTTESTAATETVSGLPTDLIKMEPGCNIEEFDESLSQSYLGPTISKYGQGSSNQLDNSKLKVLLDFMTAYLCCI